MRQLTEDVLFLKCFNESVFKLVEEKTETEDGEEKTEIVTIEGSTLTKNEIFDKVWNDKFTTDGTLNVHIRKIREAIEKDPQDPKYIVTVWKEDYKFVAPE